MRAFVSAAGAAWLGLWLSACGGNVVVDGDASGAGGAGGAGPSTGPGQGPGSTGPGPSTTTTAGQGGGPVTPCQSACDALAACSKQPASSCASECAETNPNCAERHNEWLSCLAQSIDPTDCSFYKGCEGALGEYLECEAFCEDGGGCWQDPNGACGCTTGCDDIYETACSLVGDDWWSCTCITNGEAIGECQGPQPDGGLGCDITGCCSGFFFVN